MIIDFDSLVGKEFSFYGVDGFEFKLDDIVYEALEDENDGYRSALDKVEVKEDSPGNFFRAPLAMVRVMIIENKDTEDGYELIDVLDKHKWLRIGTNWDDNYYPYFIFNYEPKITP